MDKKRIEEIRARCEAATAGPLEVRVSEYTDGGLRLADKWIINGQSKPILGSNWPPGTDRGNQEINDLLFFAHSRQDVPDLLDALEEERERSERMRIERDSARIELACDKDAGRQLDKAQAENERLREALKAIEDVVLIPQPIDRNASGRWNYSSICIVCNQWCDANLKLKHRDDCPFKILEG